MMNHLNMIINNKLLCTSGREVTNVFYCTPLPPSGEILGVVPVATDEDVRDMMG